MPINDESIKKQHRKGLRGLFSTYSIKNFLRGFRFSLPCTLVIATIIYFFSQNADEHFEIMLHIVTLALSIIPNLLGFMLGGYAILISFGNTDILKQLVSLGYL